MQPWADRWISESDLPPPPLPPAASSSPFSSLSSSSAPTLLEVEEKQRSTDASSSSSSRPRAMTSVAPRRAGQSRWPLPALLSCSALLLLMAGRCHADPSGPASDSCSTLVQSRFFGYFLSPSVFPAVPCSWTLQNPDPRRYTVFAKVTKPTGDCVPSQLRTFQYESFLESTRTYLGMESFDEVVRLCDASAPVAFLEAGKQFLQMRKGAPRAGEAVSDGDGDFKTEYLVVGKRNPSMAACQMLCQWLEDCLTSSTSSRPCGIMQTPCLCWEPPPPLSRGDGCYHNGVYLENCLPGMKDSGKNAEINGESERFFYRLNISL